MIPTDNKCPKVKELIEELQRCDQDHRVRLVIGYVNGFQMEGSGPISVSRWTVPSENGFKTCVGIIQDETAE